MSLKRSYKCDQCGATDSANVKSDNWSDWYEVSILPIDYDSGWGEHPVVRHFCEKCMRKVIGEEN